MAHVEGEHRRQMESKALDGNIEGMRRQFQEARIGQFCGLALGVICVLAGTFAVLRGHDVAGTLIGGAGLGGIVTAFIVGRSKNNPPQNDSGSETQVLDNSPERQ